MRDTVGLAYAGGLIYAVMKLSYQWVLARGNERVVLDIPHQASLAEAIKFAERSLRGFPAGK